MFNRVTKRLMWIFMWFIHCLMWPYIMLNYFRKRKRLPIIRNNILFMSATTLARKIRNRELTSEDVVQAFISRILDVDLMLNAVVEQRFDGAILDARLADQLVFSGTKTPEQLENEFPFLGVPMTVKESLAVQGLSHAAGCKKFGNKKADEDAESVRLMRAAGAIPLLVSNTPELCMSWETHNKIHGVTNNPYDLRRTVAGSSGGEAALIGSGASVMGLASDIAGSARLPALFTGIFGHKPTSGLISFSGHFPTSNDKNWHKYASLCPMARYAEDLLPMLRVLSDENVDKLQLHVDVKIPELNIYYMEDDGGAITSNKINPELKSGMKKVIEYFSKTYNITAQEIMFPEMKTAFEMSSTLLMKMDGITSIFQKDANPEEWKSVGIEVLKYMSCLSSATAPAVLYGITKKIMDTIPEQKYKEYEEIKSNLQRKFKELLGSNSIFLYPTFINTAHFHGEIYYKFLNSSYLSVFNVLEFPVTQCTIGLGSCGVPLGLQIVAAPCQDRLTLAVSRELEKAFGGWVEPSKSD